MLPNGPGSRVLTMTWITSQYVWLMSALFVLSSPGSTAQDGSVQLSQASPSSSVTSLCSGTLSHTLTQGTTQGSHKLRVIHTLGQQSHRLDQVGYERI